MLVAQVCLTRNSADFSLPSSFAHEILQARIMERVAFPFSRGPSWSRDRVLISCIAGSFFTVWAIIEGNGYLLQYFCLENSKDRGAWWATVHRVARSWTIRATFTFKKVGVYAKHIHLFFPNFMASVFFCLFVCLFSVYESKLTRRKELISFFWNHCLGWLYYSFVLHKSRLLVPPSAMAVTLYAKGKMYQLTISV